MHTRFCKKSVVVFHNDSNQIKEHVQEVGLESIRCINQ